MGGHRFAGGAEVGDRLAQFFGHARGHAELVGANEKAVHAFIRLGHFQRAHHIDHGQGIAERKRRSRRRVQPAAAQVQFQYDAVTGQGGIFARALHRARDHAGDQHAENDEEEHSGQDRADDDADDRAEESNPELFHESPF